MQPIGKKDKLQKSEIISAVEFFNLGKLLAYTLVKRGNINSNYIIKTSVGKYILRVYKFKTKKEILSELDLLNFLHSKKFPCPNPAGKIYKEKNKLICCFKYIEGQDPKIIDSKTLQKIARLLANLHVLSKNYKTKYKREGEGLSTIKRYLKNKGGDILKSEFKGGKDFISYLKLELDKLHLDKNVPAGVVHIDVKKENIIVDKNKNFNFIDFDNFYLDYFVMDIGSALMWLCVEREKLNMNKIKMFLEAYESVRKMSKLEKDNLLESIKFCCLKQAFKYAYICLPRLKFAEKMSHYFVRLYKNINNGKLLLSRNI
jgi:homoserine kinase type II